MEILLAALLGLCFGSFVTMASHRLPRDMEIVKTRSHCPACKASLAARDLVPVLSWALAGGKCRHCRQRVSLRYPLTEMICAALFVFIFLRYGVTAQAGVLMLFAAALLTMIVADFETRLIPDEIHYFLLPLGIGYHFLLESDPAQVAVCAALGLGLGLLLHYGYYWLRGRHGLGLGDVKFLAIAGLWLGDARLFVVFIFFSGVLGVITGTFWRAVSSDPRFPFGPALAASLFALVAIPEASAAFWMLLSSLLTE